MKNNKIIIIMIFIVSCSSLGYKYTTMKFPVQNINIESSSDKLVKVVIYNGTPCFLCNLLKSQIINIYINKEGITRLNSGQYIQLFLPIGSYKIELEHQDVWFFNSEHIIDINKINNYFEIHTSIFSNEIKIVDKLPEQFSINYIPIIVPVEKMYYMRSCVVPIF